MHPRVHLELAPQEEQYPFIVFRLPSSVENEQREDFIVEVDIWDNSADTTALENLTSAVDKALDRLRFNNTQVQTCLYRMNRLMVPDTDPQIRRRRLRYQAKTYFKE